MQTAREVLGALCLMAVCWAGSAAADGGIHVIFVTDCSERSDWMAEALVHSHFQSNTAGNITRIAACADPSYQFPAVWHPKMALQVTPSFERRPLQSGEVDVSPAHNTPWGISYWLDDLGSALDPNTPVVLVEPDMLISDPLEGAFQQVRRGETTGHVERQGADVTSVSAPYAMVASDWQALSMSWAAHLLRLREQQNSDNLSDLNLSFNLAAVATDLQGMQVAGLVADSAAPDEAATAQALLLKYEAEDSALDGLRADCSSLPEQPLSAAAAATGAEPNLQRRAASAVRKALAHYKATACTDASMLKSASADQVPRRPAPIRLQSQRRLSYQQENFDDDDSLFHVIISTDCTAYSDWMSEALIYTHFKTDTAGWITRISSCDDYGYIHPMIWHPRMILQVTPNYEHQTMPNGEVDKYPIYNKPMGVSYWINDKGKNMDPNTVVVMMDTDMLIGLPLEKAFRDPQGRPVVEHGRPAAQIYLIGSGWFTKMGCASMMEAECAGKCVPKDTTEQQMSKYYMVGCPYALTHRDWEALAPLWTRYTLRVRQFSKGWAHDMYGYVLAAMHLGLRHEVTPTLMLSNGVVTTGEGWHLIDGLDPTGRAGAYASNPRFYQPQFARNGESAPILHYCQTYRLRGYDIGDHYQFSKYEGGRHPAGLADCSQMPEYMYDDDKALFQQRNASNPIQVRKDAYMVRVVAGGIYEALSHYRDVACGGAGKASRQPGLTGKPVVLTDPSLLPGNRPLFGTRRHRNGSGK